MSGDLVTLVRVSDSRVTLSASAVGQMQKDVTKPLLPSPAYPPDAHYLLRILSLGSETILRSGRGMSWYSLGSWWQEEKYADGCSASLLSPNPGPARPVLEETLLPPSGHYLKQKSCLVAW